MRGRFNPWWLAIGVGALLLAGGPILSTVTERKRGPRWERLHPELRRVVPLIEAEARAQGLEVMFWDGWRDPQLQAAAIAAGTSRMKDPYNGPHVWGLAVDFVFRSQLGTPSWPPNDDARWQQLAAIMERHGLVSLGMKRLRSLAPADRPRDLANPNAFYDWPHAELPGYPMAELRRRYGTNYLAFIGDAGTMTV